MTSTTNAVDHGISITEVKAPAGRPLIAACLCGWSSPLVGSRPQAVASGEAHIADVSGIADNEQTEPATIRHGVPEWQRPLWATSVSYDGNRISFEHSSRTTFVAEEFAAGNSPSGVNVCRMDQFFADGENGTRLIPARRSA